MYINEKTAFTGGLNRGAEKYRTAENIRECLMAHIFFRSNFRITVPVINNDGVLENGDTVRIQSIGTGHQVAFSFDTLDASFIRLTGNPEDTINNDTISGGEGIVDMEIEMYRDTNVFLGMDDMPQTNQSIGIHLATLSKSYFDSPIWFDLNSLINSSKKISANFLNTEGWCDAGTLTDFRFTARLAEGTQFYVSNVLFALTGYDRSLEENDLLNYIYNTQRKNITKPLTKQPTLTHIKGQRQYFNFILSDPERDSPEEYNIGILYKLYSQSKRYIGDVIAHEQSHKLFNVANTIKLDIDGAIEGYNAGYVEVYLCRDGVATSEPLSFRILPGFLYKVNDFAFLNSLGGWSSFNFSGTAATDFKTSTNTIYKTQTPSHTISSDIESVYTKEVDERFTVQTMPINESVCNWLKELSSSMAVYELSTKRYVIVDELNIRPNSSDELFRLEMKYHYSDKYNAII